MKNIRKYSAIRLLTLFFSRFIISFVCRKDREWESEKLEFTSWCDYGIVGITDYEGAPLKIHAPDVKEVVAGFIDEETLNLQDDFSFDD